MEFAIFDFFEEEASDIGKVSLISDVENMCITASTFDYAQIVEVNWGGKRCVARIVKFGATRQQLKGDLEQFLEGDKIDPLGKKQLGRGHRDIRAKTWLDPDEIHGEDESTSLAGPNKKLKMVKKSMAEKGRNVLDTIKLASFQEGTTENAEARALQKKVNDLQEENCGLRAALRTLKGLDDLPKIIQQLEGVARKLLRRMPQPMDGATRAESTADKEPEESPKKAKDNELISLQVLAQVSKANANKMTNDLMMAMFDLDMLSSCSLTGKTYNSGPPKPTLDLQKVQAIIGAVRRQFMDRSEMDIRQCMRMKLNNAAKKQKLVKE